MKIVYRLYYTTDNSLEYHGEETSFLVIPKHFVESIQYLFQNYPNFITISQLPCENTEEKVSFSVPSHLSECRNSHQKEIIIYVEHNKKPKYGS